LVVTAADEVPDLGEIYGWDRNPSRSSSTSWASRPAGLLLAMILRICCLFAFLAIVVGASTALNDHRVIDLANYVVARGDLRHSVLSLCKIDWLTCIREHADVIDVCRVRLTVVDHGLVCLSLYICKLVVAELLMLLQMAPLLYNSLHGHCDRIDADQAAVDDVLSSVELARLHHQDGCIAELLAILGASHRFRPSLFASLDPLALLIRLEAVCLHMVALT